MLMHHANARPPRDEGIGEANRAIVEDELAFVGLQHAADDIHQRAFPGAVLAADDMHLARADVEIDARQRLLATKRFRHVAQSQERVRTDVLGCKRAHAKRAGLLLEGAVDDDFAL